MKKLIFLLLFCFIINSCSTRGQLKDFDDTIFFIVDKDAKYVTYTERKDEDKFEIEVKCNYYKDIEIGYDNEYAGIFFSFDKNLKEVPAEIILMNKKHLSNLKLIDTEWIAQQESRDAMYEKIPWDWCWKRGPHFVIFKKDLLSEKEQVKVYLVACGEREIEY